MSARRSLESDSASLKQALQIAVAPILIGLAAIAPPAAAQVALPFDRIAPVEADARRALASASPGSEEQAVAQMILGSILQARGRHAEAEPLLRAALATALRSEGSDGPNVAFASARLAITLIAQQRVEEAERMLRRAVTILSANADTPAEMLLIVLVDHAMALTLLDRAVEAEPVLRRALALTESTQVDGSATLAMSLMALGVTMMGQGRHVEAEAMLRRAVALAERHYGPTQFETRRVLVAHGAALRELGRTAEAEQVLRRAVYAHAQTGIWDNVDAITAAMALADLVSRRAPVDAQIFYARAALGVRQRIAAWRDHGPAAQAELRMFAPVFHGQVRIAWAAQGGRR